MIVCVVPAMQHIMIDLGTGNNNKVNWAMTDKQEFIDIVEVVYRGARKGRGLVVRCVGLLHLLKLAWICLMGWHAAVGCFTLESLIVTVLRLQVSPKDYSTKYRY